MLALVLWNILVHLWRNRYCILMKFCHDHRIFMSNCNHYCFHYLHHVNYLNHKVSVPPPLQVETTTKEGEKEKAKFSQQHLYNPNQSQLVRIGRIWSLFVFAIPLNSWRGEIIWTWSDLNSTHLNWFHPVPLTWFCSHSHTYGNVSKTMSLLSFLDAFSPQFGFPKSFHILCFFVERESFRMIFPQSSTLHSFSMHAPRW